MPGARVSRPAGAAGTVSGMGGMDIGVPYRDLGPVDIGPVLELVRQLPDEAWTRNSFRQDVLADKAHNPTRALIYKHEVNRWENPWRLRDMEDHDRATEMEGRRCGKEWGRRGRT